MKMLYFSSDILAKQSLIQDVLSESGAEIELLCACTETDFSAQLSHANIIIIQEKDFDRLLLQVISDAEKSPVQKKIAILKEPEQFNTETVSLILKQLYSNNVRLRFPIKNGEVALKTDEILYFEYSNRFVYIKTEKDSIKTTLKLKDIPGIMTGSAFSSPYVSFIVNLMYVETIGGDYVLLKNGEQIPLSQKKAADFRKTYKQYLSIMS